MNAFRPGDLAVLLDQSRVPSLLKRSGLEVRHARPFYLRIKPAEAALVGLRIWANTTEGADAYLEGYVRTYAEPKRALELAAKWGRKRPVVSVLGAGVIPLGEHSVLFLFPNDARLPDLKTVLRTSRLKRALADLRDLDGARLRSESGLTVVRYKPERRFLARVGALKRGNARELFLRSFADARGHRLARLARALRSAGGEALAPRPLGVGLDGRLLIEELVDGEELSVAARRGDLSTPELVELAAHLHRSEVVMATSAPRSMRSEVASAVVALETLASFDDDLAAVAATLSRRLTSCATEEREAVPIHGDLHLHQVMSASIGLRLVDLDRVDRGDPLIDVGSMCAHLLMHPRELELADHSQELADRFADGYLTRSTDARDLETFTAIALALRALLYFRSQHPRWRQLAQTALELAAQRVPRSPSSERRCTDWEMLWPRPSREWTGRGRDESGAVVFGRYDPAARCLRVTSPLEDEALPGLPRWLHRGELLNYRPGRRATLRIHRLSGERYVKVLAPKKARRHKRRLDALLSDAGRSGVVRGPEQEHVASGAFVFQPAVGESLHELLMSGNTRIERQLEAAAGGAARLHACPATHAEAMPPPRAMDLHGWVALITSHSPEHARPYDRTARRLELLPPIGQPGSRIVHGDLHDKNVFVRDSGCELIDLDLAHAGNPVTDIGNFTAHLHLRSLQRGEGTRTGLMWRRWFLEAYAEDGGEVDHASLRVVEAHTFFRLACLYLFRRRWAFLAAPLLEQAEKCCEASPPGSSMSS